MISELTGLALHALLRAQIAASLAVLVVLAARLPTRRHLGPSLAYGLWGLPLAAMLASVFPTLSEFMARSPDPSAVARPPMAGAWIALWLLGVLAALLASGLREAQFRHLSRKGLAGPAIAGVGWHRLVVPDDFRRRFTPAEQSFIRRHERMHVQRHDPLANLLAALIRAVFWFNPLVHLAAALARIDQELACDDAVVRHRPETRRGYAETLVKAGLARAPSPFACAFAPGAWVVGRHPLEVRLLMLGRPQPGPLRSIAGACAVSATGLFLALGVWAAAPGGEPQADRLKRLSPAPIPDLAHAERDHRMQLWLRPAAAALDRPVPGPDRLTLSGGQGG